MRLHSPRKDVDLGTVGEAVGKRMSDGGVRCVGMLCLSPSEGRLSEATCIPN